MNDASREIPRGNGMDKKSGGIFGKWHNDARRRGNSFVKGGVHGRMTV